MHDDAIALQKCYEGKEKEESNYAGAPARLWMAALDFSEWLFRLMMSSRLGVFRGFQWNWCFVSASGGRGGWLWPGPPVELKEQPNRMRSQMFFSAYLPSNLQFWRVQGVRSCWFLTKRCCTVTL